MKGWKEVKISDMGRVITGNTPPRKNPELYGSHTIFIKPTDISVGKKYTYHPEECYSELGFKKYKNSLIPKGSTCVVTIGSIGKKMTKAHCDCFINQAINAVVPNHEYDEEFIYYVLKYNLEQLKALDSGTASGRENVSKSSFSNINVYVPIEKSIQTKIGIILSAYDDLIENNLKRIKLLEEFVQRTFEEWFVKFSVKDHKIAVNVETGLPKGWKVQKLNEVALLIKKSVLPKNVLPDTPYIGLEHIPRRSITLSAWETAEKIDSLKYSFKKGDILFGKIRPYFHKVGIALIDGIASSDTIILRAKIKNLQGLILQTVFSDLFVNTATQSSNGTKMPRANWDVLKEYPIIIPTQEVLTTYDNLSNSVIETIENLCVQNRYLKESRDILLPRLMSGKIVVESDTSTSIKVRGKS